MPANIAHLLICNKAVKIFEESGTYREFITILDSDKNKPYLNLGSIGPDLSYYGNLRDGLKSLLFEKSDKPGGVDGWAYLLHSKEPNRFPLSLIEITWKDTKWEEDNWQEEDFYKFAFTCGYLSHVAADQIIHPYVNSIAGPYYRKGENRKKHRECEIYQDVALYKKLYPAEDFMEKQFNKWPDLNPGMGENAPEWFRYFIQRAFVESYSVYPKEEEIENWIDGLLFILREIKFFGPYKDTYEKLEQKENDFNNHEYFNKYMGLFFQAVELTSIYWKMVFEMYDPPENEREISDPMRRRFKKVIQNADLSSPLQQDILGDAKKALKENVPNKYKDEIKNIDNDINQEIIMSINENDVEKFS